MAWYNFRQRNANIGEGVGNYVFEPAFTLPLQSPISGAVAVRRLMAVTQAPQVYAYQSIPVSGMGGLFHGTTVLQPLITNNG